MDVGRLTRKDIKEDSKVKIGHVLAGSRSQYAVQEIIGGGASCVVARCKNTRTKETVAAKIFPAELHSSVGQSEASTLRSIHSSEGVNHSLFVKCLDAFRHDGSDCLVLEMLALDLREALQVRQGKPLPLSDIRTIAKQLFMALADLKKLGILHANLKPDSVMLVDEEDLRIKIISFGLALLEHEATPGITIQAPGIRAPEIMLGLPFSYSVDMWGVGQILLFLYNPDTVWRRSSYQNMKHLVTLLGQPPEHMLDAGRHTSRYFQNVANASGFSWRLKRPDEYDEDAEKSEEAPKCCKYSLTQLFTVAASSEETLAKDRLALLDLLKKIFCYEPSERIAPEEALQHDFITMRHLRTDDSSYLETSKYSYSGIIGEDAADKANDSFQMEISFSPPKLAKTSSEGETLYWNETSDGMTSEEDSRSSEAPLSSNSSDAATSGRSRKPPLQTKAFFRRKVGNFFASRRIREDLCCCLQPSHED